MKRSLFLGLFSVFLFFCGGNKELDKARLLVQQGETMDARKAYEVLLEKDPNPNIEKEYILFLFDNKFYVDFKKRAELFLARFPDDEQTKLLVFEYHAKTARDAERLGNYPTAMNIIMKHLLSPDYPEWRKWESRQTTILKKWYEDTAETESEPEMKKVLIQIKELGFDNLAETLNPELNLVILEEQKAAEAGTLNDNQE